MKHDIISLTELADIKKFYRNILQANDQSDQKVTDIVSDILASVKKQGDKAVMDYTNRLDRRELTQFDELCISKEQRQSEAAKVAPELRQALITAIERITDYHQRQMPNKQFSYTDAIGVELGMKWTAIERAGLYVPGGMASYPSSVLMNAIPAKVAGVKHISMVVPAPEGRLNPLVLLAADLLDIDAIYTIGGAQSLAALAYGTENITPVQVIVGPGNAYVAEAKRQLFGIVGIDMVAGPSEILVLADANNNPEWIAADLLSQAEHDTQARSILLTESKDYATKVMEAVERLLPTLPREQIARQSWNENGLIFVYDHLEQACEAINIIAPEHLELAVDEPKELIGNIHNAGAIFMGRYTPEAIGDYIAGPSHVLPTSSTASFSSGLSVYDFLKRSSMIHCSKDSFQQLSEATHQLAMAEGLHAHAVSVKIRTE